jgi:hypothetical protein
MNLQREFVACIRKTADGWAAFEEQPTIGSLPKRHEFSMIPSETVGLTMDSRVFISIRNPDAAAEAARWATYTAIMGLFIQSKEDWLLIVEEGAVLNLAKLPEKPANGLTILGPGAILVDRITARTVVRHLRLYYAPLPEMLEDLKTLKLLDLTHTPIFAEQKPSYHHYGPLILSAAVAIAVGLLICPPNCRLWSKQRIGSAEVLTPKEALVGREG